MLVFKIKEDLIIYKSQINGVVSSVFVKSGDTVKRRYINTIRKSRSLIKRMN